jgi:hypothetical protein
MHSCNCENSTCQQPHVFPDEKSYGGIRVSRCLNQTTGQHLIEFLGDVCPECYEGYPPNYRIEEKK